MIRIFKINDPYRLIITFFILLLIKLPILTNPRLITIPELKYQLIGEKIANGALLYVELWDNISPLSGLVYAALFIVFGKSYTAFQILSLILFFIQAAIFNIILIRKKAFNENVYLPSLFYVLFALIFFEATSLSPEMMGLTFIILVFDNLFNHLELRRKDDKNLINIGIYIGLASLFYLPYIIYLPAITIGLLLYTNTIKRRYLLMYYGSGFVFLLVWMFYYATGHSSYLMNNFFITLFKLSYSNYLYLKEVAFIVAFPAVFLLISFFKTFQAMGFTNYQSRIQSLIFLFFVFQVIGWFLWSQKSGASLVVFAPTFSFFLTHYFLAFRKKIWREAYFYVFLAGLILIFSEGTRQKKLVIKKLALEKLLVDDTQIKPGIKNKKVLVIGESLSHYYQNSLATPYLNWNLSKRHFEDIQDYKKVVEIYKNIKADMPDIIVDEKDVWPDVQKLVPEFEAQYRAIKPGYFERISN